MHTAAAQTLRDATKWLVATLATLGLLLSVGEGLIDASGLDDRGWRAVAVAVSMIGVVAVAAVVVFGARVLIGKRESWAQVLADRHGSNLDDRLNEAAVLWPWGRLDAKDWFDRYASVLLGTGDPSPTTVRMIGEVMEYLEYAEVRRRFKTFVAVVIVSTLATVISAIAVERIVADHTPASAPMRIELIAP